MNIAPLNILFFARVDYITPNCPCACYPTPLFFSPCLLPRTSVLQSVSITPHLCSSVRVYYPTPLFFCPYVCYPTPLSFCPCVCSTTSHHTTPLSFCPYVCYPTPPFSCFRLTLLDRECRNKYPPLNPFSNEGMKKNSKERWILFFPIFFFFVSFFVSF